MAIFHLDAGIISRGDGHSAVAAAAYRAGERIVEARTGEVHDYSRRSGVDHCEIIAPRAAPGWCKKRARLWNRAEDAERRADSQIARQIELALPRELSFKRRRRLVRRYVRKQFTSRGMVADIAYHDQDGENPHVHILLTMRRLAGSGFSTKKERSWNRRECLGEWRSGWAHDVNAFLRRAGCRNRVDHRSLAAQRADALAVGNDELAAKLDRAPGRHYGRAATAIQARADRVESADWAHGEALRIGEADQPDYRYVAEPYVPSSRVADIREAMELENAERSIRREGEQLARERIALEKRIADAARAAGLNDVEIDNIHGAAEAQEAGSGLEAVHLATKAHVEHWREARESARAVGVDFDSVSAGTRGGNTDLLKALESATERRQTEIKAEARAAGLDNETTSKLYDEAEAQRTGSGWSAVESATAAQIDRKKKAEQVARQFDIDIGNVVAAAGARKNDPVEALESAIRERWSKISTAALAAGLDEQTITCIWRAADQQEADSGWRGVQKETAARVERRRKAEQVARQFDIDIGNVVAAAGARKNDPVEALESAIRERWSKISTAALAAGLDEQTITCIWRAADQQEADSGWRGVQKETAARVERRRKAENSARAVGVDVKEVMSKARAERADLLTALESATTKRQEAIREEARTAGLDDDTIDGVYAQGEQRQLGSGYGAIESATAARVERRRKAENSARAVGVDVKEVMSKARAERADLLTALESATTKRQEAIREEARTAGLDDDTINRVYFEGEQGQSGSGFRAIEAKTAHVERWRRAEDSARAVDLDVDVFVGATTNRNEDPPTDLESATKRRQEAITKAAHANGLDDGAISRIRQKAERKSRGSGWIAVVQATDESRVRQVIQKVREELGFSPSAALIRSVGQDLHQEYQEGSGAGRLAARLETLPDGCDSLSSDEQVEQVISERLHRENIAKQEQSDRAALKHYREAMAEYKKKGYWERRRHAAPEKPQAGPVPPPPSDDQIMGYRRKLIARIREVVVNLLEKMFDIWDRLNPSPSSGVDRPAPLQAPGHQPQRDRGKGRVR
ncbi:MAG: MobA/MobL family protein [Gammaproteobacteria bacterium]|nr:MobA/MobL family protein [Gammaproteobacteria bacterium]